MASPEATRFLWDGAIPLQIHLHDSEVTTLPPPPPALVLGPRIGYLPLLVPIIRPHFSSALPPGTDTVWFDYKGLPLKWYIPTGVLFDLLCAEPERPWNLTVHFRGYPSDVLTTCEGEDSVKWSFINSLKEAAYIINGSCKNIMSMSQADQLELWQSILKGNMESYLRVSSKLKLTPLCEGSALKRSSSQSQTGNCDTNIGSSIQTGRIPVRLYVRYAKEDFEELEDAAPVDSWDNISYINRPVEVQLEEGKYITLKSAMELLLPDLFNFDFPFDVKTFNTKVEETEADSTSVAFETVTSEGEAAQEESQAANQVELGSTRKSRIKLIRIQGIEPDLEIPLAWVFNNLANPEYFLHICVLVFSDTSS